MKRQGLESRRLAVAVVVVVAALAPLAECEKCSVDGSESRVPPDMTEILKGSYSITVEMTDVVQEETYYVKEVHERRLYHDTMTDTVGISIWRNGTSILYQYYPELDVVVREFDGVCAEMGSPPTLAWGWVDDVPEHGSKSFGPSSILRLVSFLQTEYQSELMEMDVRSDYWKACAENGDVELGYLYSKPPWNMPDGNLFGGLEASLPIKMEARFVDGSGHWIYTFVEFVPFILYHSNLEPPRGMSCEGITGVLTDEPVPSLAKHFSLAEEVVVNSMIDGMAEGKQYVDKLQLTYAGEISLVSLLTSASYDSNGATSWAVHTIHDFNTGVQYKLYREFGNCSMEPLPAFSFDINFGGITGSGSTLLSPNEMLHLDDNYAYVGERYSRDLPGDLWTSTRLDDIPDYSTGGLQNFEKAVMEYYFTQGVEKKPSGEYVVTNFPFRGDLFIYNKSNPNQIVSSTTLNFADFREVDLFSPDEFSVEECYEKFADDWSYIDIFFPVETYNQIAAADQEQTRFKHEVMLKMIEIGRLSPVRLASIDVSTGVSGIIPNSTDIDMIITKIKLLERASYIFSYRQPPDEVDPRPGKNQVKKSNIRRAEDCATLCSTTTDKKCQSFFHCGEDCYLSKLPGPDGDALDIQGCSHWVFDLKNNTVPDYPSEIVFTAVADAVKTGDFHFIVPYKPKNNTIQVGYEAKMSLHYRTPDPMNPVRMQFTLEATLMTVSHPNDTIKVKDLTECMLLCVSWVRYRCETLVHQTDEGLCLLLATHYHDLDDTEVVPHSHSYVHGRSYLVDYSPIFGGVALNSTGPVYYKVPHTEACARYCSGEQSIDCQSFEYCISSKMCHLHEERFLDVVDSGDYVTGTACIHFSRKSDSLFKRYEDQGLEPSKHKLVAHLSSPSACAKMCLDDEEEMCQSYDFCSVCDKNNLAVCGEENKNRIGLCFLATHHLGESGLSLTTGKDCDHYDREVFGDQDYANWIAKQRISNKPYTPGDMTGLAFGMIFLGILLSVGFLAAITQCKPASVPKDFEISFQRLKTSGESAI